MKARLGAIAACVGMLFAPIGPAAWASPAYGAAGAAHSAAHSAVQSAVRAARDDAARRAMARQQWTVEPRRGRKHRHIRSR